MNDKYFFLLSFLSIITIFHFIEGNIYLKTNSLSPGGGLPLGLDVEAIEDFRLTDFSKIYFNTS